MRTTKSWWTEYSGLIVGLGILLVLALACIVGARAQTGLHRITSNALSIPILARDDAGRLYDSGGRLNTAATAQWMEEPECVTLTPDALYHQPLPHWRVRMIGWVYGAGPNFIDVQGRAGGYLVRAWHTSGHLYPPYGSIIIVDGRAPQAGRIAVSSITFPVRGGT